MSSHRNRLKTTISAVASSGLGDFTISAASSGYRTFVSGDNALTFDCLITEGTTWEVRTGCTYTHSGTTLSRGTLEDSSTGSAITFTTAAIVSQIPTAAWGNALENQLDRALTFIRSPSTGTQTMTASAFTKVSTILSEVVDNPKTWWDTTNKKFLPTRAGNYLIFAGVQLNVTEAIITQAAIYKNGSADTYGATSNFASTALPAVEAVVYLDGTTDYVELYIYVSASVATLAGTGRVFFKAIYLGD